MSVTNSAFLLAFVTTPINSAHQCIMHTGLVLSAHAHNIEYYYGLVKIVNNASGTRLAGGYPYIDWKAKPYRIRM